MYDAAIGYHFRNAGDNAPNWQARLVRLARPASAIAEKAAVTA
jgi:hypothetical protein